MLYNNAYDFIKAETNSYKTRGVPVTDGWEWSMFEHIKRSLLYKNSKFSKGADDGSRPFKNIVLPVLRVAYRSEGFDVKDIIPYVNNAKDYHKSFLIKKYQPKYARDNGLDKFIDEMVESYVDYGLALVKKSKGGKPEVVPLSRLAFVDQTDVLSGPICELHHYSPDELLKMSGKWYADKIDEAIVMAQAEKTLMLSEGNKAKTPGKYIEVYELHGVFPDTWLDEGADEKAYSRQMHIVTYYTTQDGRREGICLYKGKSQDIYKAIKRDPIFGRACGIGGVEELFDAQQWTNYSEIQLKEMLDIASMVLLQTSDKKYSQYNKITDLEKGEILVHEDGKPLTQVNVQPYNQGSFKNNGLSWEDTAMVLGGASEGSLGKNPPAGTPFALQSLIVQEGRGVHEYRRGQLAIFMEEIYKDWILPAMIADVNAGKEFLEELSASEMLELVDVVVENETRDMIKEMVLKGQVPTADILDTFRQQVRDKFMSSKNKFIKIVKDELKDIPVDVMVNVAGKQKDLAVQADKLTNLFRAVVSNPQALAVPGVGDIFNQLMEASGLNPIDYTQLTKAVTAPTASPPAPAEELLPAGLTA